MKNVFRALVASALMGGLARSGDAAGPFWATVPAGFADSFYATGLTGPVAMAFAPDGRLFVCQKNGELRVISAAGALLPTPFLTLAVETGGERGLLGIAFDPQFAANQYLYVYHTVPGASIRNRVSRFTANGDVVAAGSEVPLLDLDPVSTMYHNGGALHFGADGMLYVAVGDGGPSFNAQMLTNRFGKILRIAPDGAIPADNPASFPGIAGTTSGVNRAIWAVGLRNPFTFGFQPGTGRMFINDVGNATREEIDDGIAGSNYGWPTTEGNFDPAAYPNFRNPVHSYGRDAAATGPTFGECIAGGVFYPSTGSFPASYHGLYFHSDLTNQWIRTLDPGTGATALFAQGLNNGVDLDVGPDGALYYLEYSGGFAGGGRVGRIAYTVAGAPPSIATPPASRTVSVGQSADFSVSASGTAPLSYQWQRDGAPIAGATASGHTHANAQLADSGAQFRCVVTNAFGSATSAAATLTVTSNQPPAAAIDAPLSVATYVAGDTIGYSGSATDAEDGPLGAAAFTWRVDFHHNTHSHPFMPDTPGSTSGQFTIPTSGETASDVWYRITLTVVDSNGLTRTVSRDVLPVTAAVTLESNPPGLQVTLDGQPQIGPHAFQGVAGMLRTLGVVSPQTLNGTTYVFSSWSDGGLESHAVSTPATAATYTAEFTAAASGGSSSGGKCGALGFEAVLVAALLALRRRRKG